MTAGSVHSNRWRLACVTFSLAVADAHPCCQTKPMGKLCMFRHAYLTLTTEHATYRGHGEAGKMLLQP